MRAKLPTILAFLTVAPVFPQTANSTKAVAALQRAQKAAGGVDRLLAVRDITRHLEMVDNATGTKASETVHVILPNTIRLTQNFEGNEVTAFSDGISGWAKAPWNTENLLPSWQRDAAQQELMRQLESLLISDLDSRRTLTFVSSSSTGDVLEISAPGAGSLRLTIDPSGDVASLEYPRIGPRGPQATVTDVFSDYRATANGLRMPYKIRTLADGKPYMESVVTGIEYNKGLRAEVLSRKDPLAIE